MLNSSRKTNVVFDFDGTLVSCRQRQVLCLFYLLSRHGLESFGFDYDLFWEIRTSGKSTREALGLLGFDHGVVSDVSSEWVSIVEDSYWLQFDVIHEFVFDLMEALSGKNIYVLTARRNMYLVVNQIRRLGIFGYLEAVSVVSPRNAIEEKAEQLERLGADIFIGDTVSDAAAARVASVDFVGVSWGQHDERHLLREGYGSVVNAPDELKIRLLR